jgi:hypothetical protein
MEEQLVELERRLARAERRGGVMGALALVATISALTAMTTRPGGTQAMTNTVKAPLRVVDEQGRTLVEMGLSGGAGSVSVYNGSEHHGGGVFLSTDSLGGEIVLRNQASQLVADLGSSPEGGFLAMGDARDSLMVMLSCSGEQHKSSLRLISNAREFVRLTGDLKRGGTLQLRDKDSRIRFTRP